MCLRSFLWKWMVTFNERSIFWIYDCKVFFTSTSRDFDSMYSESFSFASTAKCNSMVELFASTGRGFDSSIIAIFSFASTGKCNLMVELFASTGRDFDSSIITIFSFASTGKCNLMVELFASTGRDFDSSIKFNAPTCEEYCEWFPSCGTEVAFDIKQVCFKFSSVISRDQQAAVGSLLRIGAFLSNNSLLRKKMISI